MARSGLGRFASPARLSSIDIVGGRDMFVALQYGCAGVERHKKKKKNGGHANAFSRWSMGRSHKNVDTFFPFFYPVAICLRRVTMTAPVPPSADAAGTTGDPTQRVTIGILALQVSEQNGLV